MIIINHQTIIARGMNGLKTLMNGCFFVMNNMAKLVFRGKIFNFDAVLRKNAHEKA